MARITKFGPFELDSGQFELRRNGELVKIDRTPLELRYRVSVGTKARLTAK
jgi:hypothetical protein